MKKKLSSRKGFSLTEMLVAVLILGLVTGSVATGITASIPIYQKAVALSEAELLSSTLSQAILDELRFATDITQAGSGTTTLGSYTSSLHGTGSNLQVNSKGQIEVRSGKLLIGSGSYSDLEVKTLKINCIDPYLEVKLIIGRGDKNIIETTFAVRPLNPLTS